MKRETRSSHTDREKPLTVRIPEPVLHRLQDAAHNRRRSKQKPTTQGAIVTAALLEWLETHRNE